MIKTIETFLFLSLILLSLNYQCTTSDNPADIPDNPNMSPPEYFPIYVGSKWVYHCNQKSWLYNGSLPHGSSDRNDTIELIIEDSLQVDDTLIYYVTRNVSSTVHKTETNYDTTSDSIYRDITSNTTENIYNDTLYIINDIIEYSSDLEFPLFKQFEYPDTKNNFLFLGNEVSVVKFENALFIDNIGFVYSAFSYTGNGHGHIGKTTLIEYNNKPIPESDLQSIGYMFDMYF